MEAESPNANWISIGEFKLPTQPGMEREASRLAAGLLEGQGLTATQLERLMTAIAEATMNALEHGNRFRPELPVEIALFRSENAIAVHVTDRGAGDIVLSGQEPDLLAKLGGQESPRGWGLFIMQNMVDQVEVRAGESHHTVILVVNLKGNQDVHPTT
jgi:anti-sigma regulatory factor (Ser/Thr protein kinase)